MKFYNREKELELLKEILSAPGTALVIVKGLRRIGKTSLILKVLEGKNFYYVFVPKNKTSSLFLEEACEALDLPRFSRVGDFLRHIFEKKEAVFLDEFQNFYDIDPSIYSDVQKLVDEFKRKEKKLTIFVSGSSFSLMKKIFYDYSNALYGRKDLELTLEELRPSTVMVMLKDLGMESMEDRISLWGICGGLPKIYELMEKLHRKSFKGVMDFFFLQVKSIIDEGSSILISEFGGTYKIYFTALEAISKGKTNLGEIASFFDGDTAAANRYLDLLRKEYFLVKKVTPLTQDIKKSRQGIYAFRSNFLRFWFFFLKSRENYYEQGRAEELNRLFWRDISSFLGKAFEDFCRELCQEKNLFSFTSFGSQWGSIPGKPVGENQYEIDICAINEQTKEILFGECKWQEKVDARKVLQELKEKAFYVEWNKLHRKESYALFAKSFKERITEPNLFLFDLKDLEKMIRE